MQAAAAAVELLEGPYRVNIEMNPEAGVDALQVRVELQDASKLPAAAATG